MNRRGKRIRTMSELTRRVGLPSVVVYSLALTAAWLTTSGQTDPPRIPAVTSASAPAPQVHADELRQELRPKPETVELETSGPGTFAIASGGDQFGQGSSLIRYRVEVEHGLPIDTTDFSEVVDSTLADPRGWLKTGQYTFVRSTTGPLRIILATPATTDALCAPLRTRGEVSCRNGDLVVINARRWTQGAPSYGTDLESYRQYVINHEVGHSFEYGHQTCPAPGSPAPVMLQQTLGLQGCTANPWP